MSPSTNCHENASGASGVVVGEHVANALAERGGAVLDPQPAALVVGLEDLGFLHVAQPLGIRLVVDGDVEAAVGGRLDANALARGIGHRDIPRGGRTGRGTSRGGRPTSAEEREREHRLEHGERVGPRRGARQPRPTPPPPRSSGRRTSFGAEPVRKNEVADRSRRRRGRSARPRARTRRARSAATRGTRRVP